MTHDPDFTGITDDERLIEGVSNYCHRWCERCAFTDRCLTFRMSRGYNERHPGGDMFEHVSASFQETFDLLESYCHREGIDFEQLRAEANSDEALSEQPRLDEQIEAADAYKLAMGYGKAAHRILEAIEAAPRVRGWSSAVCEAVEVIGWYSHFIGAKVHRGFHGLAGRNDDTDEVDPVQTGYNGSIKAARLAVAESKRAWLIVLEEGEAAADSPMRSLVDLLDRIDAELSRAFPLAMQFVRPGFDEPHVIAGEPSTRR